MIERILAFIRSAGAPTESDSDRDGLLSYSWEWHALTLGIAAGLTSGLANSPEFLLVVVGVALGVRAAPTEKLKQVRAEPWYACGGAVLGYAPTMIL